MRIGQLEFRKTQTYSAQPREYYEIVKWQEDNSSCYTLLIYEDAKESPDIRFVGDRPFNLEYGEHEPLWELMKYGQRVLQAEKDFKYHTQDM